MLLMVDWFSAWWNSSQHGPGPWTTLCGPIERYVELSWVYLTLFQMVDKLKIQTKFPFLEALGFPRDKGLV